MHDQRTGPTPLGDIVPGLRSGVGNPTPEQDRQPVEPPRAADDDDLLAEHRERQRGWRLDAWVDLVPQRYHGATIDDVAGCGLSSDDQARLRAWSDKPDRNLVLLGPVGTGKTHMAWACMREPYLAGMRVRGGSLLRVLDQMRPSEDGNPSTTHDMCGADITFLDDLGVERATEWTMQQVHRILDDRHADVLPTVVTSNLEPPDLKVALGEATYSRLIGSGAIVLRLAGNDRRRGPS